MYLLNQRLHRSLKFKFIVFVVLSLRQMTPLHVAAERGGRFNIVEYLVGKEADINIKDNNGVKKNCDLAIPVH